MNKKSIKQYVHDALVLFGASLMACAVSFLFIVAGPYVHSKWHIAVYVVVLFIMLPGIMFFVISWYMWLLERWFAD